MNPDPAKSKVADYQATESFRLLAQACFGVIVGMLLAAAIARQALPPDGRPITVPEGLLTLDNVWLKPRDRGFYLLSLILGGVCSYFATYKILAGRVTALCSWVALILLVPICNYTIGHALAGHSPFIPAFEAIVGGSVIGALMLVRGHPLSTIAQSRTETSEKVQNCCLISSRSW